MPLRGGASPPDKVLIAPGPTIAVGDRGLTRLYDQEGHYLGSRPGAVGFLSDGGLVTLGKPGLAAYSSEGTLLWKLDPWRVVQERLGLGQHLVPNSSQAFVSPAGVVYYFFDYQVTGHDGMLAGLLVVDARGQIVGCEAVPCAVFMRFLPGDPHVQGEFFVSTGVSVERGQAYRVFSADGLVFTLHRTVYVASGTIYAAAADGTYLVRNPIGDGASLDEAFIVCREGSARALSFCLPEGHHYADWTPTDASTASALCGATKEETALHVDHILPRSRGGKNTIDNLQVLCANCNEAKSNRNTTDLRAGFLVAETATDPGCPFCGPDLRSKAVARGELCFAVPHPRSPVAGHLLVVPFRHAPDFLALTADERRDCEDLLRVLGNESRSSDEGIRGFSVLAGGAGSEALPTSHAHVHLIPERDGSELTAVVARAKCML